MPADHFAVFKACTRSYGVTVAKIRDLFKGEIPRKRGKTNQRVCSPVDFRNKVVPELKPLQELVANIKGRESKLNYSTDKGIPQGLPISAVLANMYMLGADKNISTEIEQLGGSYRRYSDDILLIVPRGAGRAAEEVVTDVLNKFRLKTKDSKTNRVVCLSGNKTGRIKIDELDKTYANTGKTSMISYLGFSFDGKNISVKDGTISRFLTKETLNKSLEPVRI